MPRRTLWACSLVGCIFAMATVEAAEKPRKTEEAVDVAEVGLETQEAIQPGPWRDVILPSGEKAGRLAPLPPNVEVRQLTIDGSGVAASSRVTTAVYRNTNPLEEVPGGGIIGEVFARGAGLRVSDDMTTTMVTPCPLNQVVVQVHGGNMNPDSDPEFFDVTLGVWNGCPNTGGQLLAGTSLHEVTFLEDNILWELVIPLPTHPTPPTSTIWVSGNFSSGTAGFIVGSPPENGFSRDGYDDPVFACSAKFGSGFPTFLHSSWAAKVYAEGVCETHFLAYSAINDNAGTFDRGRGIRLADDLVLTVDVCELSTYEIAVLGTSSNYTIKTDLRTGDTDSGPLTVIPGTEAVFQGTPGAVRFFKAPPALSAFPPGIALLEGDGIWMTWLANRADTGLLRSGDTQVGDSTDFYAWEDPVLGWRQEFFPSAAEGIFYIAVNCRGEAPLGACCRLPTATSGPHGVCADQVPAPACPLGRWLINDSPTDLTECFEEGVTPDPFSPPCGTAACCFETLSGASNCLNLTKTECDAKNECVGPGCLGLPGIWQPGAFCGEEGQECFNFACYFAENECTEELFEIVCDDDMDCPFPYLGCGPGRVCDFPNGCEDLRCCDTVCDADRFCCDPQNGWDNTCARRAQNSCALPPTNDECSNNQAAGQQALEIELTLQTNRWRGEATILNMDLASRKFNFDPNFCCSSIGVDEPGSGTLWYFFTAGDNTSARITTCNSPGGPDQDSIIQVFRESPALPGSWTSLPNICASLGSAVACNDDAGCGTSGRNSDMCVAGLKPNETVMVMIASPTAAGVFGDYKLTVEAPCPSANFEPTYSACTQAFGPIQGSPSGIEDEMRFDCSGDPGTFCLENTTLNCPGEPELLAMKNDIWIGYKPGCTGTVRLNTCIPIPPNPIPDTTLAIYGRNPNGGGTCPAQGGLLFGANDDSPVTPVEATFNDQICSVGTESCASNLDCVMPGSTCIGSTCVLSCTTNADCQVNAVSIGECVGQVCVRPCETDADCPLKTCNIVGNLCTVNGNCSVGTCSWSGEACDTGQPPTAQGNCDQVCRNRPDIVCTINGGQCDQVPNAGSCITQTCKRIETCEPEVCQSSCWPGSSITAPVNRFETYIVRIGGEFGSEPEGSVRLVCTEGDCNFDGTPDVCEVSCAALDGACDKVGLCGTAQDCHLEGDPGYLRPDLCDIRAADGGLCAGTSPPCSRDCQRNDVPDDCEIRIGTSLDCNLNKIPDECDMANCAPGIPACDDCQPNGKLDVCDIADGTSLDANTNGIPDECEAAALAISWESVAVHGAVGPVGLIIPPDGTFSEPRSLGGRELIVTYDDDVTAAGSMATIVDACDGNGAVDVSGIVVSTSQGLSNEVVITFTPALPGLGLTPGTHDPVRYLVELTGVGGAAADTSREFTVVLGDAFGNPLGTGDRRVNAQDNGFVRSLAAQGINPIDPGNAQHVRADVFTNGAINAQDNGLVRSLAAEGLNGQALVVPCP